MVINKAYFIHHYERKFKDFPMFRVYHDEINGSNEDPYVWNKKFLWTFCNRRPYDNYVENDLIFWVNIKNDKLLCDCVFLIRDKYDWTSTNKISLTDKLVDNKCAFINHYRYVNKGEHKWNPKFKRYTLKADPDLSFLPHDSSRELIDLYPLLLKNSFQPNFKKGKSPYNWPVQIPLHLANLIYQYLSTSNTIIKGHQIALLHPNCTNQKIYQPFNIIGNKPSC